jgi:hypothetical protein
MAKKKTETAVLAESPKQPQELRVSLPPDSKLKSEIKGGWSGIVTVTAKGRVTGYSMDKYGCSLTVELKELDVDGGMSGDVRSLKKQRGAGDADNDEDDNY